MIALDAGVLSLLIYSKSSVPQDFKTKQPIDHAKERVNGLIAKLEKEAESILIPAPALGEALVVVAPDVQKYVDEIESQSCFKIKPFGTKAAIEIALRVKRAVTAGDKREGVPQRSWDKIKYDHQIVAIAKVEGATTIYSMDEDIHIQGKLWGIEVLNISTLEIPLTQSSFPYFDKNPVAVTSAIEVAPKKEVQDEGKNETRTGAPTTCLEESAAVQGSDGGRTEDNITIQNTAPAAAKEEISGVAAATDTTPLVKEVETEPKK